MIYVDDQHVPFRGMIMNHLVGDTVEELHAFAARIGLKREWFQGDGWIPHYDVSISMTDKAIFYGAASVSFGREPWRCNTCDLAKLACVKRLRCECGA